MRTLKFRAWDVSQKVMFPVGAGGASKLESEEFELFIPNCILMQFTGLLDTNGTPVYEGDILQDTNTPDWKYEVVWGLYEWGMALIPGGMQVEIFRHRNNNGINYKYEVVGNIYENPELLVKPTK